MRRILIAIASGLRWCGRRVPAGTVIIAGFIASCGGGGSASSSAYGPPGNSPAAHAPVSAKLSWYAPTLREDGTPLEDLAGYRVYCGRASSELSQRQWIDNPSAITWTVSDLESGTWYFAMTAVDRGGLESRLSNIVSKTIP